MDVPSHFAVVCTEGGVNRTLCTHGIFYQPRTHHDRSAEAGGQSYVPPSFGGAAPDTPASESIFTNPSVVVYF